MFHLCYSFPSFALGFGSSNSYSRKASQIMNLAKKKNRNPFICLLKDTPLYICCSCTEYFDAAVLDAFPKKRTSVRILDAGAGQGSTASYLRSLGYNNIDALTVSKERLDRAEASGLYRNLLYTALKAESTLCATGAFDAMICADGVFPDEVDPDAMDEMLRLVKPGSYFMFSRVNQVYG